MKKRETKILYDIILIVDQEKTSKLITSFYGEAFLKFDALMPAIDKITAKGYIASVQFWKYQFLKNTKREIIAHYEGGQK